MKETADSKERINIPWGLSEKTDGAKISRKIKNPPGGLYRRDLRLDSQYENVMTKNSGCLVVLAPFVICPCSFSLLGANTARGRGRWAVCAVPGKAASQAFGVSQWWWQSCCLPVSSEMAPLFSSS